VILEVEVFSVFDAVTFEQFVNFHSVITLLRVLGVSAVIN